MAFKGMLPALVLALAAVNVSTAAAAPALHIVVYGGSGHIGQRIVHEALSRGHTLRVVVREPDSMPAGASARLSVVKGDVRDVAQAEKLLDGADVVVCAVSFRKPPDPAGYRAAAAALVTAQRSLGARAPRLIFVGGAGSLEERPGVLVADQMPSAFRAEALGQKAALDYLRGIGDVPWTYFSPAASIAPGERTGHFRLGGDQLIRDAHGASRISMEDYAVAVIDEAEHPVHLHRRFTIGY